MTHLQVKGSYRRTQEEERVRKRRRRRRRRGRGRRRRRRRMGRGGVLTRLGPPMPNLSSLNFRLACVSSVDSRRPFCPPPPAPRPPF
jgi:hypothetical protein